MKERIDVLETMAPGITWGDLNMNPTFGQAYLYSLEAGNKVPNFNGPIWDKDIEEIVENCKRFGITQFTVSSTYSGVVKVIARFTDLGYKLKGIVKIKSLYKEYASDEYEIIPAFKMSI